MKVTHGRRALSFLRFVDFFGLVFGVFEAEVEKGVAWKGGEGLVFVNTAVEGGREEQGL